MLTCIKSSSSLSFDRQADPTRLQTAALVIFLLLVVAHPVVAQLDLRGEDHTFSSGTVTDSPILVDEETHITIADDADVTFTGIFRDYDFVLGDLATTDNLMGGRLTIGEDTIVRINVPNDPQIALATRTRMNGIIYAPGGVTIQSRTDGISTDDGFLTGSGVMVGGFSHDPNGVTIVEDGLVLEHELDVGSHEAIIFASSAFILEPITISGGTLQFFSDANDDKFINMSFTSAPLSGHGNVNLNGEFSSIAPDGTLTIGKASANRGSQIQMATIGNGDVLDLVSSASQLPILRQITLAGGTISSTSGVEFSSDATSSLRGTISGIVRSSESPTLNATGTLSMGSIVTDSAVDLSAGTTLNVGGHRVELNSGNDVRLRGATTLDGGQLHISTILDGASKGDLDLGDSNGQGASITGNGFVFANILPHNSTIAAQGSISTNLDLNVGDNSPLVLSEGRAVFNGPPGSPGNRTTISIDGGTLNAANGIHLGRNSEIVGNGTINGSLTGDGDESTSIANAARIVLDGDMTIGDASSDLGYDYDGNLSVGSHSLTILDATRSQFGETTTIDGGEIIADRGIHLPAGHTISGRGLIHGSITGAGTLTPTGVFDISPLLPLTIGNLDFLTVLSTDVVEVSDEVVGLSLTGGELRAPGGFLINGNQLTTGTSLLGPVQGQSTVTSLFTTGNVTMGDATRSDGVQLSSAGFGSNVIGVQGGGNLVLLDSDGVEANQLSVTGGSIRSDSGFIPLSGTSSVNGWGLVIGDVSGFQLNPTSVYAGNISNIDLGDSTLTILSQPTNGLIDVLEFSMSEGGRITTLAGVGQGFVFRKNAGNNVTMAGTVDGATTFEPGLTMTATGDLTMGHTNSNFGFEMPNTSGSTTASRINVGSHHVTLLDANEAEVDEIRLAGGRIRAANGFTPASNAVNPSIEGNGIIFGEVDPSISITATTGDLWIGSIQDRSPVVVGSQKAIAISTTRPLLFVDVQISGGEFTSAEGLEGVSVGGDRPEISGFGFVRGTVSGSTDFNPTGNVSINGTIDVGAIDLTLLTTSTPLIQHDITLAGGTLRSTGSNILIHSSSTLTGFGAVAIPYRSAGSNSVVATGDLTIGDATSSNGVDILGDLDVASHTVTLLDADAAEVSDTTIDGGTLAAPNGVEIGANFLGPFSITGNGIIRGAISGPGTLNPTGVLTIHNAIGNVLDVGAIDFTLLTTTNRILQRDITIAGATLRSTASNPILHLSSTLSGFGTVALDYRSGIDNSIIATGDLTIGDESSNEGVEISGSLDVASHTVTLLDADTVPLGGMTTLAGGTLVADNGLQLAPGTGTPDVLEGFGVVQGTNGPLENRGEVRGPTLASGNELLLDIPVTGDGAFTGAVRFTNELSPGLSPGQMAMEHMLLDETAQLTIELGGLVAGTDYDQIVATGNVDLGGSTLLVDILPELTPGPGQEFTIINVGGDLTGNFFSLGEGDIVREVNGVEFFLSYAGGDGNDVVVYTAPPPIPGDFDMDGDVDGRDFLLWQRNPSVGNLADWQTNYGAPQAELASPVAVPEPASVVLLVLLCGTMFRRNAI